jgi:hypothetical protein
MLKSGISMGRAKAKEKKATAGGKDAAAVQADRPIDPIAEKAAMYLRGGYNLTQISRTMRTSRGTLRRRLREAGHGDLVRHKELRRPIPRTAK